MPFLASLSPLSKDISNKKKEITLAFGDKRKAEALIEEKRTIFTQLATEAKIDDFWFYDDPNHDQYLAKISRAQFWHQVRQRSEKEDSEREQRKKQNEQEIRRSYFSVANIDLRQALMKADNACLDAHINSSAVKVRISTYQFELSKLEHEFHLRREPTGCGISSAMWVFALAGAFAQWNPTVGAIAGLAFGLPFSILSSRYDKKKRLANIAQHAENFKTDKQKYDQDQTIEYLFSPWEIENGRPLPDHYTYEQFSRECDNR